MDIVFFGIVWVILSAVAEWALYLTRHNSMYFLITDQGKIALDAFNFLTTMITPVFLFVIWFLIYTMIRFRAKTKEAKPAKVQSTTNPIFTGIWIIGSIVLNVLFWLHPTAADLEQMFAMQAPQNNRGDLVVDVTARQWEWMFSYPQYGLTQTVNARGQDELVIPVHKRVKFVLRSYDPFHTYDIAAGVIHSFWIPAFGFKEDVIPGETRYEYMTVNRTASYRTNPEVRVQCAEVCGPGHPWMEAPVSIVTHSAFKSWVAKQKALQAGSGS